MQTPNANVQARQDPAPDPSFVDPGELRHPGIRLPLVVFLLVFLSCSYFQHSEPGWNVNSRLALTLALVETGSPVVDEFVIQPGLQTEDLASHGGHLYSDKTIGTSLLGIPAVYLAKTFFSLTGIPVSTAALRWFITAFSVGITAALAGVLLMYWLAAIDVRSGTSGPTRYHALLAIAVALGTMLFQFGSLYMSYAPATCFLLGALLLGERATRPGSAQSPITGLLAGVFGGLSILCEYTYAAAAGLAGLYFIYRLWSHCHRSLAAPLRFAIVYGLGMLLGVLPFVYYTWSLFGSFTIPYQFHVNPQFRLYMSRGFMGATSPDPAVLWLTSFHPFRGMFLYSPHLLLGFIGLFAFLQKRSTRALGLLCLSVTVFYILFTSAYYMWWGGWSFSLRHLAPAVPFLAAGMLPWLRRKPGRVVLALAGTLGIAVHLAVNATEPQPPDGGWQAALLHPDLGRYDYPSVFIQHIWPRLASQHFDINLGTLLGLHGLASLLPLLLLWTVGLFLILRYTRRNT